MNIVIDELEFCSDENGVRIGAGGGIGCPEAVDAAFATGAYIDTETSSVANLRPR